MPAMSPDEYAANVAKRHIISAEDAAEKGQKGGVNSGKTKQERAAINDLAKKIMAEERVGFVKARMRAYAQLNPDKEMTPKVSEWMIRDALRETAPDRIDVMVSVA